MGISKPFEFIGKRAELMAAESPFAGLRNGIAEKPVRLKMELRKDITKLKKSRLK